MQVEWRRNKVLELLSKGDNQSEIAKVLQVDLSIISRDVYFLRQQAKDNIKRYIHERLPEEYEKCLVGLNAITKEAWNTSQNTEDKREKIQALSLAKECYSMKLDLITNATVVDDSVRFVTEKGTAAAVERTTDIIKQDEQLQSKEQESEDNADITTNQVF